MNVEQFTNKVKEQISAAQIKALQKQHQQLLSLHMLSVLLEENACCLSRFLPFIFVSACIFPMELS